MTTSSGHNKVMDFRVDVHMKGHKGDRPYMEDVAVMDIKRNPREVFVAVYDGHGGKEAANFAKKHLWNNIKASTSYNSDNPLDVRSAITEGFMATHKMMFDEHGSWPKRRFNQNSTAGTTATVAIIKGSYLYIGHAGDSGAVLAQKIIPSSGEEIISTRYLTRFHKPDSKKEKKRIESLGGKVAVSKGVPRVVWKRPTDNSPSVKAISSEHGYEYIPFLAVSRSLGDCWSYVPEKQEFLVSPQPDVTMRKLESGVDMFLILASDGLWGVMDDKEAGRLVDNFDRESSMNINRNVSDMLVDDALKRCKLKHQRADNITALVVEFQPSDPSSYATTDEEVEDGEETPPSIIKTPVDDQFQERPRLVRKLAFRCDTIEEIEAYRTSMQISNRKRPNESLPSVNLVSAAKHTRQIDELEITTEISQESLNTLKLDLEESSCNICEEIINQN